MLQLSGIAILSQTSNLVEPRVALFRVHGRVAFATRGAKLEPRYNGAVPRTKPEFRFPAGVESIWRNSPNLELCSQFRDVDAPTFFAHIRRVKCERCVAAFRQLDGESRLIAYLMRNRN